MGGSTLHLHEVRIGTGLPARTVRPYPRRGDALLAAFREALAVPAERVVLTGSLFARADPPAHLVDRTVRPLAELVARGVVVVVPVDTPRSLLLLAAGVSLGTPDLPGGAPEFHRSGAFRLLAGNGAAVRRVDVPGVRRVSVDVTGLAVPAALERIGKALRRQSPKHYLRLRLVGETAERGLVTFGPRELLHLLPEGAEGTVENRLISRLDHGVPEDEEERREALRRVRESLPEVPETTGIYEFRDERERALYVGKAVNLRRRVASHFTAEVRERSPRGPMLVAARSLHVTETRSEVEALLLEADRIRERRPPYNRQMREPEAYRYLRVALEEPRPGLSAAARPAVDGAIYHGPFTKRWVVERAVRVLQVAFGMASCSWEPGDPEPLACTDRDLSVCSAPCAGRIGAGAYRERVVAALDHLTGEARFVPAFGALNPLSAGLLGPEDLRIFESFRRSFRWLRQVHAEANGELELPGDRTIPVRGGLRGNGDPRGTPRSWVPPDRVDELRILARALRRQDGA